MHISAAARLTAMWHAGDLMGQQAVRHAVVFDMNMCQCVSLFATACHVCPEVFYYRKLHFQ